MNLKDFNNRLEENRISEDKLDEFLGFGNKNKNPLDELLANKEKYIPKERGSAAICLTFGNGVMWLCDEKYATTQSGRKFYRLDASFKWSDKEIERFALKNNGSSKRPDTPGLPRYAAFREVNSGLIQSLKRLGNWKAVNPL